MSSKRSSILPKRARAIVRISAAVLLNLGIVLSGVYVLFHILDKYNPHRFIYSNLPWLPIAIPILFILSVLLYDLLLFDGAFKKRRFRKERMWLIILCDLILFAALSLTVYLKTCSNPIVSSQQLEAHQLATPVPRSAEPLTTPDSLQNPEALLTDAPAATDGSFAATAAETPAPSATPIPISAKFADKYSEIPVEQVFDLSNVVETENDGTEKALIYSYSGKNAAVDIYHYKKGKLEYQVADIYIRDISCFTTSYVLREHDDVKTQGYMEQINAIVAVNGDNFNSGRMEDGLVVRNGAQLFPSNGERQTSFSRDLCVVNYDGSIRIYDCVLDRISYDELISQYPLHVFNFGPKLLNDDGTSMQKFNSTLGKANPRTVLGYYEPGHYALIVVLGLRNVIDYDGNNLGTAVSPGMTLIELSALCEKLGFRMAYNLDGGGSSSMSWDHSVFGNNDRKHGDVLAIVDP